MLLDWLGHHHNRDDLKNAARCIENAVDAALANPAHRTVDLGGSAGTRAFAAAVVGELEKCARAPA